MPAVACFRVVDAVKSVLAIENAGAAIGQIAQTTLRKVVGQHSLDQTLSETDRINADIRKILDAITAGSGAHDPRLVPVEHQRDVPVGQPPDHIGRRGQQVMLRSWRRLSVVRPSLEDAYLRITGEISTGNRGGVPLGTRAHPAASPQSPAGARLFAT